MQRIIFIKNGKNHLVTPGNKYKDAIAALSDRVVPAGCRWWIYQATNMPSLEKFDSVTFDETKMGANGTVHFSLGGGKVKKSKAKRAVVIKKKGRFLARQYMDAQAQKFDFLNLNDILDSLVDAEVLAARTFKTATQTAAKAIITAIIDDTMDIPTRQEFIAQMPQLILE